MRLRFSRRAVEQIRDIEAFIAKDDPRTAEAVLRRIDAATALIARHPLIGRQTTLQNVRVFNVLPYPYLVFYLVDEIKGAVTVLRVRHMARRENWQQGR